MSQHPATQKPETQNPLASFPAADPAALYLDLLKLALLNLQHLDAEPVTHGPQGPAATEAEKRPLREVGLDRPPWALSMVGLARLDQLVEAVRVIVAEDIPGDLIETGVWRGGASALLCGALLAFGDRDRRVWLADSFKGLPPPDPRWPADAGDTLFAEPDLAVPQSVVAANLARFGLPAERFAYIEGFFEDTLPNAPVTRLSLLRLDGDMYGSTIVALEALYDKVSPGGFIIVDDYGCYPSCAQAVHDFLGARGLSPDIRTIDWTGAYWRKEA